MIEQLENSDIEDLQEAEYIDFALLPPDIDNDTDIDDIADDDLIVEENNIRLLGKGILAQRADIEIKNKLGKKRLNISKESTPESMEKYEKDSGFNKKKVRRAQEENIHEKVASCSKEKMKKSGKRKEREWENIRLEEENSNQAHLKIKNKMHHFPTIIEELSERDARPLDFFKLFWPTEFIEHMCSESEKYAKYKYGDDSFSVTPEEIYKVIAILLLSGYNTLPNTRMYWETKADVQNAAVSNAMSRDNFLRLFRNLHFSDNNTTDESDRCRKVRPLLDHMSSAFENYAQPLPLVWSLDEAMEPYYGHHHMKQFIRGKPIRFGYKFWCLNRPDGYCVRFKIYEGREDRDPSMTLGSSVTKKMVLNFVPENSEIFIDNYFNSLPLLEEMKTNNINITGTIRNDRIEKAPLRDLKKEPRGSVHGLKEKTTNISLFRWHDNSQVTLATNRSDDLVCKVTNCRRYSRSHKRKIDVLQPSLIKEYNNGMGGVDLFDQFRGRYRINIRSRKWYWPIVRFCINASIVNAWLLFRSEHPRITQLDFLREIVIPLLSTSSIPRPRGVLPRRTGNVQHDVRFDRTDHWPMKNITQRRCARCHKCVTHKCSKCNVGLHIECFAPYHLQ